MNNPNNITNIILSIVVGIVFIGIGLFRGLNIILVLIGLISIGFGVRLLIMRSKM